MLAGFWDILAKALLFLSVKYLTGLGQTPAVTIYTVDIGTAGVCPNPVKYFTDKESRALAKISQNPASNALQVLELVYRYCIKKYCCMWWPSTFSLQVKRLRISTQWLSHAITTSEEYNAQITVLKKEKS